MGFGVVEAVNKFAAEFEYEILCLTYESVSSYVLVKDVEHPNTINIVTKILAAVPVIEIRDFPNRGFQVKNVHLPNGKVRNLHSF